MNVPGLGQKKYEQAAGFLRIRDGSEILDSTWVHPESYPLARKLMARAGVNINDVAKQSEAIRQKLTQLGEEKVALITEFQTDSYTLSQVIAALLKPGRDPRDEVAPPLLRAGVLSIDELQVGSELTGTVTNVVDFGAFVDVGLKNDGLVHISRMATHFISSPHEVVSIGQSVRVWVDSVDSGRGRIGLTMLRPQS